MEPLVINMLGEFSISCAGRTINDSSSRSKKLWTMLEYLITFRDREISQNELIELLWHDDDIENPSNTLKTLIYRVRSVLDELEVVTGKQLLVYRRGACSWSDRYESIIDTDLFEGHIKNAAITIGPEKLKHLLSAIEIYKGDFLPKSSLESWAVPIVSYYHSQYIQAVHQAISMLTEEERYGEIAQICHKATVIDPYDEDLHYWLILSLFKTGEQQQALRHYDHVTEMFFSGFGVTPTERLTSLYKEIISITNSSQMDLSVIRDELNSTYSPGAFFCEYAVFKDIYFLNTRTISRTGTAIHLGLITLVDAKGNQPQQKLLNKTMVKLKDCITSCLRRGDVFTRYSVSQFLIMLPAATYENASMATERIQRAFKQQNPKSPIVIKYSVLPVSIEDLPPLKTTESH